MKKHKFLMIGKPGRPNYHVKASYISLISDNSTCIFSLDAQGNIKKDSDGKMAMSRVPNLVNPIANQPPVTKEKTKVKKTQNDTIQIPNQIPAQTPIQEQVKNTEQDDIANQNPYDQIPDFIEDTPFLPFDCEQPFGDIDFSVLGCDDFF